MSALLPTAEHQGDNERIDSRMPHAVDEIECQACGHVWVAVRPLGLDFTKLECPKCCAFDSDLYDEPNTWEAAPKLH